MLKLGIDKIDYAIISHMDSDHAGGMMYILENIKTKNVLIGLQSEASYQLETLFRIIENKNIDYYVLEKGMKVNISQNCFIDVLWPTKNYLISENALNNNSLVFKFYYNNFSILFTGDIEEIAEKQIVEIYNENLKSDILKVAHHGSKTSTIKSFLEYVKPKIALIGVGKDNKFGHPNKEIINKLEKSRSKYF